MSKIPNVTSSSFEEEVLGSERPVLVDFYATWCAPCRLLTPMLEGLAEEYAGRVDIVKVDIDTERDLASRYGITGVPTVKLFDAGQVVHTSVGLPRPEVLRGQLESVSEVVR
jgi:thioredoxin 1